MIQKLRALGEATSMSPEVRAYMQNIIVFLRIERGVAGGVTPYATVLFEALSRLIFLWLLQCVDQLTDTDISLLFTVLTMSLRPWLHLRRRRSIHIAFKLLLQRRSEVCNMGVI
jgi:hypothetical protein